MNASISNNQGYLRNKLQVESPELFETFLNCAKKSEVWLSSIPPQKDSYNSHPHIRNLEEHLNSIIGDIEKASTGSNQFVLSQIETFLLLMGIRLHDIGRLIKPKDNKNKIFIAPPECALGAIFDSKKDNVREEFLKKFKQVYQSKIFPITLSDRPEYLLHDRPQRNAELESRLAQCEHCLKISHSNTQTEKGYCEEGVYHFSKFSDFLKKDSCGELVHCPLLCYFCLTNKWNEKLVSISHDETKTIEKDHSIYSWEMLRNPETFYALGIQSSEIAHSLANICLYHGPKDEIRDYYNSDSLNTVYLEPYGKIREMELAVLLKLADTIDGSYQRAVPEYIPKSSEVVGRFRKKILSVSVFSNNKMISTVLADWSLNSRQMEEFMRFVKAMIPWEWDENSEIPRNELPTLVLGQKEILLGLEKIKSNKQPDWNFLCTPRWKKTVKPASGSGMQSLIQKVLSDLHIRVDMTHESGAFVKAVDTLNEVYVSLPKMDEWQKNLVQEFASEVFLLQVILDDVKKNLTTLKEISSPLSGIGLRLYAWLIEYKEHLYDVRGNETHEPIYDKQYLIEVAKAMWEMSTTIFGKSLFSYEHLAAKLYEPDVEKIKTAVRRIKIVTQNMKLSFKEGNKNMTTDHSNDAIWYGEQLWKWNTQEVPRQNNPADLRPMAALLCKIVNVKKQLDDITPSNPTIQKEEYEKAKSLWDTLFTYFKQIHKEFMDGKNVYLHWDKHFAHDNTIDTQQQLLNFIDKNPVTAIPFESYIETLANLAEKEIKRIDAIKTANELKDVYGTFLALITSLSCYVMDEGSKKYKQAANAKCGDGKTNPEYSRVFQDAKAKFDNILKLILAKETLQQVFSLIGITSDDFYKTMKKRQLFKNAFSESFESFAKSRLKELISVLYTYTKVIGEFSLDETLYPAIPKPDPENFNDLCDRIIRECKTTGNFIGNICKMMKEEGFLLDMNKNSRIVFKNHFVKAKDLIQAMPKFLKDHEKKYIDAVEGFFNRCFQEFEAIRDNFEIKVNSDNVDVSQSIALLNTAEMLHALMTKEHFDEPRIGFVPCDDVIKRINELASPHATAD